MQLQMRDWYCLLLSSVELAREKYKTIKNCRRTSGIEIKQKWREYEQTPEASQAEIIRKRVEQCLADISLRRPFSRLLECPDVAKVHILCLAFPEQLKFPHLDFGDGW